MGDTGSMLLGLLLAYAPISSIASLDYASLTSRAAYQGGTVNRFAEILPLMLPAAILVIPYADLLLAVVRRTRGQASRRSRRIASTCITGCSTSATRIAPAC